MARSFYREPNYRNEMTMTDGWVNCLV